MRIIGYDDSINTCDCCGKSNLKLTVVVEIDGEIMHYGTTCATRRTGMSHRVIKQNIDTARRTAIESARAEYLATPEYADEQAAMRNARSAGIKPGRDFAAAVRPAVAAANIVRARIAEKYGIDRLSI